MRTINLQNLCAETFYLHTACRIKKGINPNEITDVLTEKGLSFMCRFWTSNKTVRKFRINFSSAFDLRTSKAIG